MAHCKSFLAGLFTWGGWLHWLAALVYVHVSGGAKLAVLDKMLGR